MASYSKRCFLLLLLLLLSNLIRSQELDSLKFQLATSNSLEQKVNLNLSISTFFSRSNPDSALFYSNKAEQLIQDKDNYTLLHKVRNQKSGILILKQEFDKAQKLLMMNLESKKIDSLNTAMTYQNLGNIYNYRQEYESAINYYIEASNILEKKQDTTGLGKVYTNIGVIHSRLNNLDKAIFYLDKALSYLDNNEILKMQVLSNLSGVYFNTGNLDKAIATSLEAEALAKKKNISIFFGIIYSNLCNFYLEKKKYDIAIDYGIKGLAEKEKYQQNTDIIINNLGYAYLQKGDYKKAIDYLHKIPSSANADLRVLIYNNLRQAYEKMNDFKKALSYANQYTTLKDSLNLTSQQTNVAELTEKYESEKKQQQIDLLQTKDELNTAKLREQRNLMWGLSISSVLFIAFITLWYRGQKIKQSLKTTQIQQRLLQTQLNPHFFFHALNSIQGYIYQNKKEESAGYLSSFSKLMRSILESSDQDFITLEEDISAITEYLELQKLNLSDNFSYHIDIDKELETEMLIIPPMFTQPFVENAILHGLKGIKDGIIIIQYSIDKNHILITISDNGKGYSPDKKNANQLNRSMSTDIINDRVKNFKKTHRYYCTIKTDTNKKGTLVHLSFPLRYKKM